MAQATVYDRLAREIQAAATAPVGRVRGQLHSYAAEKIKACLADVLSLLPPEEARQWIAMRRAALDAMELVGGGIRG